MKRHRSIMDLALKRLNPLRIGIGIGIAFAAMEAIVWTVLHSPPKSPLRSKDTADAADAEKLKARALASWESEGGALNRLNKPGGALAELDLRKVNRSRFGAPGTNPPSWGQEALH